MSAQVLDDVLARLPESVALAHRGDDRLLVGRGGVFVLHPAAGVLAAEVREQVEELAAVTRERMARHLTWVPFVDWFVVSDREVAGATPLPTTLLAPTVLEREAIPETVVEELQRLLEAHRLLPLWRAGLPSPLADRQAAPGPA